MGIEQDKEKNGDVVKVRRSELCEMDECHCGALDSGPSLKYCEARA